MEGKEGRGRWALPSLSSWAPGKDCNWAAQGTDSLLPLKAEMEVIFPQARFLPPPPGRFNLPLPPPPSCSASCPSPSPLCFSAAPTEAVSSSSSGQNLLLDIWKSNKGAVPAGVGVWPGGTDPLCLTARLSLPSQAHFQYPRARISQVRVSARHSEGLCPGGPRGGTSRPPKL